MTIGQPTLPPRSKKRGSLHSIPPTQPVADDQCLICLNQIESNIDALYFPCHSFHRGCFQLHASRHGILTCPCCGDSLRELSDLSTLRFEVAVKETPEGENSLFQIKLKPPPEYKLTSIAFSFPPHFSVLRVVKKPGRPQTTIRARSAAIDVVIEATYKERGFRKPTQNLILLYRLQTRRCANIGRSFFYPGLVDGFGGRSPQRPADLWQDQLIEYGVDRARYEA